MLLIITLTSIIAITILVWIANRTLPLPFSICPICAGVTGTWLWLMGAHFWGYQIDLIIPAMLMGGTVVGVMSKLERLIEPKFVLVWKTVFVVSGFLAVNSLIMNQWLGLVLGVIIALVFTFSFKIRKIKSSKQTSDQTKELEQKMKNCC